MISQLLVEFDALKAIADDAEAHRAKDSGSDSPPIASMARIFVMAATNSLSAVDPAFLQPGTLCNLLRPYVTKVLINAPCSGRFENVVYVGLPNAAERREILKVQRAKMPWHSDVQLDVLVEATERANAASLVALCQAAAIQAMQRVPRDGNVSSQEQVSERRFSQWDDRISHNTNALRPGYSNGGLPQRNIQGEFRFRPIHSTASQLDRIEI